MWYSQIWCNILQSREGLFLMYRHESNHCPIATVGSKTNRQSLQLCASLQLGWTLLVVDLPLRMKFNQNKSALKSTYTLTEVTPPVPLYVATSLLDKSKFSTKSWPQNHTLLAPSSSHQCRGGSGWRCSWWTSEGNLVWNVRPLPRYKLGYHRRYCVLSIQIGARVSPVVIGTLKSSLLAVWNQCPFLRQICRF